MSVVIVATLDTKGEVVAFARERLRDAGHDVHVIDVGIMGDPEGIEPDTNAGTVAGAAGEQITLEELREDADRGEAVTVMGAGAATVCRSLHQVGVLEGILGLGGSGNTSIATTAMRALPLGVPKVMLSTVASGDVEPYVDAADVTMSYSVADVEGLNRVTRQVVANAAHAVAGMVEHGPADRFTGDGGPTIAISMFGVTTPCVKRARELLEERGYETIVFHATGSGGRSMESLIRAGEIDGVLDLTTTEWADELVGGVLSAGPERLDAAGAAGLPQVVSVGALDMVNFGPRESVPERFADRRFHEHNPSVTLMRTTPAENAELGEIIAEKLNAAGGPTTLALPLRGVSMLDAGGEPFHDPAADEALFDALREHLDPAVGLLEVDAAINDDAFAEAVAERLDELLRAAGVEPSSAGTSGA